MLHARVLLSFTAPCRLQMFGSTVRSSGSERHSKYVDSTEDMTVNKETPEEEEELSA